MFPPPFEFKNERCSHCDNTGTYQAKKITGRQLCDKPFCRNGIILVDCDTCLGTGKTISTRLDDSGSSPPTYQAVRMLSLYDEIYNKCEGECKGRGCVPRQCIYCQDIVTYIPKPCQCGKVSLRDTAKSAIRRTREWMGRAGEKANEERRRYSLKYQLAYETSQYSREVLIHANPLQDDEEVAKEMADFGAEYGEVPKYED